MKQALKPVLNGALWTVQMLIMLVTLVLFHWPARLLTAIARALNDNLGASLTRGPYYWFAVQRRKLKGEPLWQEHDLMLGIMSPEMEKTLAEAKPLMGPLGEMVPGPVPIMKPPTNGEHAKNLREQAEFFAARAKVYADRPPDEPAQRPVL